MTTSIFIRDKILLKLSKFLKFSMLTKTNMKIKNNLSKVRVNNFQTKDYKIWNQIKNSYHQKFNLFIILRKNKQFLFKINLKMEIHNMVFNNLSHLILKNGKKLMIFLKTILTKPFNLQKFMQLTSLTRSNMKNLCRKLSRKMNILNSPNFSNSRKINLFFSQ